MESVLLVNDFDTIMRFDDGAIPIKPELILTLLAQKKLQYIFVNFSQCKLMWKCYNKKLTISSAEVVDILSHSPTFHFIYLCN